MKPVRQSIGGLGNLLFKQAYLYARVRDGIIPDLYVQDEAYFADYTEEIKMLFGADIQPSDKVSLHIRLGDYKDAGNFYVNLLETDYYQRAVELFPDDTFLVFCRDRQGAEQDVLDRAKCVEFLDTFIKGRYEFFEGETEVDDLNTMAGCTANIMANSSFSFWGAYLGGDKKVVAPKEWFTDGIQRVGLPSKWIRL